jgi:hypothetical protein
MKILRRGALILATLLLGIQFVRPARTNPSIDERLRVQANTQIAPPLGAILERACNDCHSSETKWPWYSEIAPVSWYLIRDVNEGRRRVSFSDWGNYPPARAARKLEEICREIEKREMPPTLYVLFHPGAELSDRDRQMLCDWSAKERARLVASQGNSK